MSIFALQKIEEIVGKLNVYKLIVDETCQYDEFEKQIELEGTCVSELTTIQARLQDIANLRLLPETKFRVLENKKGHVTEYEIKTKHLRVYLIQEVPSGRVIVFAGKKTTQKKDIKLFREVKKRYLETEKKKR